jgi:hypothetical protein
MPHPTQQAAQSTHTTLAQPTELHCMISQRLDQPYLCSTFANNYTTTCGML